MSITGTIFHAVFAAPPAKGMACAAALAQAFGLHTQRSNYQADSISISGTLTPKIWTDKTGATRPSLDIVAQAVLTPYHAKRKRKAVTAVPVQRLKDDFPESESLDF